MKRKYRATILETEWTGPTDKCGPFLSAEMGWSENYI